MNDLLIITTLKNNYEYLKPYYNFYKKIWKPKKILFYIGIYSDINKEIEKINKILDIKLENGQNIGTINNYIKNIKYYVFEDKNFIFYDTLKNYDNPKIWNNLKFSLFQINKFLNYLDCKKNFTTDCDDFHYVKNPELEIEKKEINFHNLEFIPYNIFNLNNKFNFISNHYFFRKKGNKKNLCKEESHNYCRRIFMNGEAPHVGKCEICKGFDEKYEKNIYYEENYKNLDHICFSFGCFSKEHLMNNNMFWDQSSSDCKMINDINKKELEHNFDNYYILSDEDIENNVILNIEDLKEFFI
jgi:hypothetical protein